MVAQSQARERLQGSPRQAAQRLRLDALQRTSSDASAAKTAGKGGLPDMLRTNMETMSGIALDDVRVHRNSGRPAQLNALAYAQGNDIHLGPGQEQHLPHEAWHVVQQKQGRVRATMQMAGMGVNDEVGLEKEADLMGRRAASGETKESGYAVASRMLGVSLDSAATQHKPDHAGRPASGGAPTPRSYQAPLQARWMLQEDLADVSGERIYFNKETNQVYDEQSSRLTHLSAPEVVKRLGRKEARALMREVMRDVRETNMETLIKVGMSHEEAVKYYVTHRPKKRDPEPDVVTFEDRDFGTAETIDKLLELDGVSVDDYKAPDKIKGASKSGMPGKIENFNTMLDTMFQERIYSEPFIVRISVGDLKGFGDVTAGAKLAKELKDFYDRFKGWKKVTLQLYLQKVETLRDDEDEGGMGKLKAMVERIIGGARVQLVNFEETPLEPDVTVSYPAHNMRGDVGVQQYGYQQLSSEYSFGSGPGFGALGVLSIDPQLQDQAVALADDPADSVNLRIVEGLCRAYKVEQTHFAYFSIYKRSKDFARSVCEAGLTGPTAMVFARSAESIDSVAASLRNLVTVGRILKIEVVGESFNIVQHAPPGAVDLPLVLLINFSEGVQNVEMLSLYYQSTGTVGATGDQSFMEAYAMRRLRGQHDEKDTDILGEETEALRKPDILYDVAEQQRGLLKQINELEGGEYLATPSPGLKPIHINDHLSEALDSKLLLYPMVTLINQALNNK